ncbi:MAG: hypothetical protein J07HX5_00848 [halophilic archaeon J07HX5]|nr:MAG: hypothetical protein J07HX5_00848 [halophilic archaeon J07HX5]
MGGTADVRPSLLLVIGAYCASGVLSVGSVMRVRRRQRRQCRVLCLPSRGLFNHCLALSEGTPSILIAAMLACVIYRGAGRVLRGRTEDGVFRNDERRCLSNHLTPRYFTRLASRCCVFSPLLTTCRTGAPTPPGRPPTDSAAVCRLLFAPPSSPCRRTRRAAVTPVAGCLG